METKSDGGSVAAGTDILLGRKLSSVPWRIYLEVNWASGTKPLRLGTILSTSSEKSDKIDEHALMGANL